MVLCESEVAAWLVNFQFQGRPSKSIFLDKVSADAYAQKWHGIITPMHCPVENVPSVMPDPAAPPWDGETKPSEL